VVLELLRRLGEAELDSKRLDFVDDKQVLIFKERVEEP
jgi:hypothetical protein